MEETLLLRWSSEEAKGSTSSSGREEEEEAVAEVGSQRVGSHSAAVDPQFCDMLCSALFKTSTTVPAGRWMVRVFASEDGTPTRSGRCGYVERQSFSGGQFSGYLRGDSRIKPHTLLQERLEIWRDGRRRCRRTLRLVLSLVFVRAFRASLCTSGFVARQ